VTTAPLWVTEDEYAGFGVGSAWRPSFSERGARPIFQSLGARGGGAASEHQRCCRCPQQLRPANAALVGRIRQTCAAARALVNAGLAKEVDAGKPIGDGCTPPRNRAPP